MTCTITPLCRAHPTRLSPAALLTLALVVLSREQIDLLLYLIPVLAERLPLALVSGRRLGHVVFFGNALPIRSNLLVVGEHRIL